MKYRKKDSKKAAKEFIDNLDKFPRASFNKRGDIKISYPMKLSVKIILIAVIIIALLIISLLIMI